MTVGDWPDEQAAAMTPSQREGAFALVEDLQERQAIKNTNPPYVTFAEIDERERLATKALCRAERFTGEHTVAAAILEVDLPRLRTIARRLTPFENVRLVVRRIA